MKSFLAKSILYISAILIVHIIAGYSAGGAIDAYYLRFTSPPQSSLIIGSSRAAQGLQPSAITAVTGKDIFNFAFTAHDSPYGPIYLNAISNKIKPDSTDGIFILSVSPWLVSSSSSAPEDVSTFRERDGILADMTEFSMKPNFEYLIKNYHHGWLKLFRKTRASTQLHEDGWLEITVNMDENKVAARKARKLEAYRNNSLPSNTPSQARMDSLRDSIRLLQQHGRVFLVRLPAGQEVLDIEASLMPDFDKQMRSVADDFHLSYLDFSSCADDYTYIDGVHLYKDSGSKLSGQIALLIDNDMAADRASYHLCSR